MRTLASPRRRAAITEERQAPSRKEGWMRISDEKREEAGSSLVVIRPARLCALLAISRTTLWRRVRAGDFPAPRRLGPNIVAWLEDDVRAWLESRPEA